MDNLLNRGVRVRAVARSRTKAEQMLKARPQFKKLLDFYYIDDLTSKGVFDDAVRGIDGVIHIASVSLIVHPDQTSWPLLIHK